MTPEILNYLRSMENLIGKNRNVIEIGSMNVNGSARQAIHHAQWIGVDIKAGRDVDVVVYEDHLDYFQIVESMKNPADTFVICECLEHVKYPIDVVSSAKYALWNARQVAEDRGINEYSLRNQLLIITSPSYGFQYHAYPKDYWRFTKDTMEDVFFDGMEILDLRYLNSNEGPNTTVAGIARFPNTQ